jgi:hypothetical protein
MREVMLGATHMIDFRISPSVTVDTESYPPIAARRDRRGRKRKGVASPSAAAGLRTMNEIRFEGPVRTKGTATFPASIEVLEEAVDAVLALPPFKQQHPRWQKVIKAMRAAAARSEDADLLDSAVSTLRCALLEEGWLE